MERRLGRGLGSLLGAEPAPTEPKSILPIEKITPNPFQPRKVFAPGALEELQASIREHGVLQPIAVRKARQGYEIIAGERRWRASQALGLREIPAIVREGVSDQAMLELALVENLQREDLDPLEKSKGFQELIRQGLTQDEVAKRVGMQRPTVANFLRLLELPESVQDVVRKGLLGMGHARAILGLSDPRRQEELCALAVRRGMSVREVEERVRELQGRATEPKKSLSPPPPAWVRDLESRIRAHLGSKVQVKNNEGYRGQILVEYHGREDLDRLLALLAPKKTL